MTPARVGRPRQSEQQRARRVESTRRDIADAALTEFTERGYYETSLTHIGQRLGTVPSMMYKYFAGKREILEYAVEDVLTTVTASLTEGPVTQSDSAVDFSTEASKFSNTLADLLTADPRLARMLLIFATVTDPELRARWVSTYGVLKTLIDHHLATGVRSGRLHADLDTERTARIILAIPFGLVACDPQNAGDPHEGHALVKAAVALVTRAIYPTEQHSTNGVPTIAIPNTAATPSQSE